MWNHIWGELGASRWIRAETDKLIVAYPPEFADIAAMAQSMNTSSSNVLYGAKAIALHAFGSEALAHRVIDLKRRSRPPFRFPMFKLGGTICARISDINDWIDSQVAKDRAANDEEAA
ncbi:MAG: hypothetical protein IE910_11725 [Brevundimonas sp.]|nr:hypothetical protein [Brevundimonas sp.]